jgi:predicted GIY-YIG superfamily endonuclease
MRRSQEKGLEVPQGKQVKVFLVDGRPGGLLTAQIANWTGHVLKGPRQDLARIRQRPEASRTGVYILLGPDPESTDGTLAYIGQTDEIAKRLGQHNADHDGPGHQGKDFFQEVVVVTSKDENLTSAHVRYLEARLIDIASAQSRARLLNGNAATQVALPEGDVSDMEYFIEQLRLLLPVLGVNIFRGRAAQSIASRPRCLGSPGGTVLVAEGGDDNTGGEDAAGDDTGSALPAGDSPVFHLRVKKWQVEATAQVIDGEFTVLKGSRARAKMADPTSAMAASTANQHRLRQAERQALFDDGTLRAEGATAVVTRDRVFSSPSSAAALVVGRASANGRIEWRTADSRTYADWESGGAPASPQ